MKIRALAGIALQLLAITLGAQALQAQQPPQVPAAPRITLADAKTAVDAAEAEARRNNWSMVFVITDAEGTPIYVRRMDGVRTRNYEIAMGKVRTAITTKMNTPDYAAAVQAGRIQAIEGGITFDGGLLLRRGGEIIGAFSASGGTGQQDAQTVRAGMAAIGIQP